MFVIPDMRPYDRNTVTVRDADLPLDASVGSLKIDASPYYRSGILIPFPVRRLRAGVLYLVLDDGTPMPSGAVVRLEGQSEEFPVALRGEVYLNGFGAKNRLVATWKDQSCAIDVPYPQTEDPLPDLGQFVCKGVRP
jgi:outer membrane usher protein